MNNDRNIQNDFAMDVIRNIVLNFNMAAEARRRADESVDEADNKVRMYRAGRYTFPPPPVGHIKWTEADWIRYIDNHGRWLGMLEPKFKDGKPCCPQCGEDLDIYPKDKDVGIFHELWMCPDNDCGYAHQVE